MRKNLRARAAAASHRVAEVPAARLLRMLAREIADDDVFGMAAEMAYRFLFAVFPLLLLLAASLGYVGDALGIDGLFAFWLAQVAPILPADAYALLTGYVDGLTETRSSTFLTVGIFGTIWGVAGGVGTLIKGLNRAYDVATPRPLWQRQLLALGVTLILPPLGLTLLALAVIGNALELWLGATLGLQREAALLAALGRWPVLAVIMMLGLSLIYHVLPNVRHRYVWSLPGAAFATACWLALTQAFTLYVANFGRFDATYGSFGAIIAFLLWLYLVGMVILLGAEINAVLEPTQRNQWRAVRQALEEEA